TGRTSMKCRIGASFGSVAIAAAVAVVIVVTACGSKQEPAGAVCGNGVVEAGEQCDPPNGTTCSATCQSVAAPTCGDGKVNAPGEQCDPPNVAATTYGAGCDAMCKTTPSLCAACETTKCDALFGTPNSWGCAGLSGAAATNCA